MKWYEPDYVDDFHCIAGSCRHTCCQGWEIDIDDDTAAMYQTLPGMVGERLRAGITRDEAGSWHFVNDARDRCPMLTEDGLCSLVTAMGDQALCQICTDHPRFRNFFADREELGLGMCCEAAAALMLGRPRPMSLQLTWDDEQNEPADPQQTQLLSLRDVLLKAVNDEHMTAVQCVQQLPQAMGLPSLPTPPALQSFYLALQRLDEAWTDALHMLSKPPQADEPIQEMDQPLRRLMEYLLYRHVGHAAEAGQAAERILLCVLLWQLVTALLLRGDQTMERLCELSRLMSSQLEYSDENMEALLQLAAEC